MSATYMRMWLKLYRIKNIDLNCLWQLGCYVYTRFYMLKKELNLKEFVIIQFAVSFQTNRCQRSQSHGQGGSGLIYTLSINKCLRSKMSTWAIKSVYERLLVKYYHRITQGPYVYKNIIFRPLPQFHVQPLLIMLCLCVQRFLITSRRTEIYVSHTQDIESSI